MGRFGVTDAPGEQAAAQPSDEHDAVGKGGVAVIQGCAQDEDRHRVRQQVLPTAMQEGQGEDADKTFGGMRHDAPLPEAYTIRLLDDFHQPHHHHDDERDDEAT